MKQLAVITGGNRGLGRGTAKKLAAAGYAVVLTSRDLGKGEDAAAEIRQELLHIDGAAGVDVTAMALDLSSFSSVRAFASAFRARGDRLDLLVCNAGVMQPSPERFLSVDGHEVSPLRVQQRATTCRRPGACGSCQRPSRTPTIDELVTTHEARGYNAEMDSEPVPTATGRRGVVGAVVVVAFVVVWCVAGVRGIVVDDSRWVWGMFPYVLKAKVERIDFLDDKDQRIGTWKLPKRGRPPPALQVGRSDDRGYGYGKGAWDELIIQLGVAAFQTAPKNAVVVEIQCTTRQSEREPLTEIIRVVRP